MRKSVNAKIVRIDFCNPTIIMYIVSLEFNCNGKNFNKISSKGSTMRQPNAKIVVNMSLFNFLNNKNPTARYSPKTSRACLA